MRVSAPIHALLLYVLGYAQPLGLVVGFLMIGDFATAYAIASPLCSPLVIGFKNEPQK